MLRLPAPSPRTALKSERRAAAAAAALLPAALDDARRLNEGVSKIITAANTRHIGISPQVVKLCGRVRCVCMFSVCMFSVR